MADSPWWTTISADELLDLRRQLLQYARAEFGGRLKGEIEDIVQDAFGVLFRHRESVKPDNNGLCRYLKTVTRHAALDRIRTANRRHARLKRPAGWRGDEEARSYSTAIPPEEQREQNEKVWAAFRALNDLDRLVIWSYAVDQKSIRAISRDLNLNWHRVAGIVYRSLSALRRRMMS